MVADPAGASGHSHLPARLKGTLHDVPLCLSLVVVGLRGMVEGIVGDALHLVRVEGDRAFGQGQE